MVRALVAAATVCATLGAAPYPLPTLEPMPRLGALRQAQENAFMHGVKRNQTVEDMTGDVPHHVGEHVAYICEIEEVDRPTVVVGQCGRADEPVDVYLELPPGSWRVKQRVRVLGIMDSPASWSDLSSHTTYYPFVKAVFVDRLQPAR